MNGILTADSAKNQDLDLAGTLMPNDSGEGLFAPADPTHSTGTTTQPPIPSGPIPSYEGTDTTRMFDDDETNLGSSINPADLLPSKANDYEIYSNMKPDANLDQNFLQSQWSLGMDVSKPKRGYVNDLRGGRPNPISTFKKKEDNCAGTTMILIPISTSFLALLGNGVPGFLTQWPIAEYADLQLTNLLRSHRESKSKNDKLWEDNVNDRKEKIKKYGTKQGQEEAFANSKDHVVTVLFKIRQLQAVIAKRNEELERMQYIFNTEYTSERSI
ncbi:UNVERIFIED_CONTAM: hypothetical protein HDU68_007792 [Siphonaria sp. JEL0065]|nr:hypothetical protein HDU68_007792 [Siphonaria sp. JEL0065]